MDAKYVSRAIPFTAEKLNPVETYRANLQSTIGFKISLSDAIVHAIKVATELQDEVKRLKQDVQIMVEELERLNRPKNDER